MEAMPRILQFLTLILVALSPRISQAQPWIHREHDWTMTVGGADFGVRELVQEPGGLRWTVICAGERTCSLHRPFWVVVAALLAGPALALLVIGYLVVGRRGNRCDV
jgi:hypothetical protein